jgi:hypothetical protein
MVFTKSVSVKPSIPIKRKSQGQRLCLFFVDFFPRIEVFCGNTDREKGIKEHLNPSGIPGLEMPFNLGLSGLCQKGRPEK